MIKTHTIKEVNYIKGLAILLVCIGHAATASFLPRPYVYEYIVQFIYSFHMSLFFLVSGFLSYKIIDLNLKENYFKLVKSKFLRLGIPFLTFSFITNLLMIAFKIISNGDLSYNSILEMIKVVFLYPEEGIMGALWFLYTIFIISLIAPLIMKLPLKFSITFTLLLNIFIPKYIHFLSFSRVSFFLIYFLIGSYFRNYYYNKITLKDFNKTKKIGLSFISLLVIITYAYIITNQLSINEYALNILNFLCVISAIYLIFILIKKLKSFKILKYLSFLGNYSMDIYLLSWFFQIASMISITHLLKITNYNIFFISNLIIGFISLPFSICIIRKVKVFKLLFLGETTEIKIQSTSEFNINN